METTYRLNTKEITMTFLESLKTLFSGQDIEITVKTLEPKDTISARRKIALKQMIEDSRHNAPKIDQSVDIRSIIDEMYNSGI